MKKITAMLLALALCLGCFAFAESDSRADAYGYALNYLRACEYEKASIQFSRVGDYSDAQEYINYINVIQLGMGGLYAPAAKTIANLYADFIDADMYQSYFSARQLMEEGNLEAAEGILISLNGFCDSYELINSMADMYNVSIYEEAEAAMNSGDWDTALEIYRMLDDRAMIKECFYLHAQALAAKGDFEGAREIYASIIGYKDAVERYNRMNAMLSVSNDYSVGSIVTLGTYPMSASRSADGKSWDIKSGAIEWIVLAVEDGKALLITRDAIDSQIYASLGDGDDEGGDDMGDEEGPGIPIATWASSSLRVWLNDTFIDTAFTAEEASLIVPTALKAERNPKYPEGAGADTVDRVFVLSVSEQLKYFKTNESRLCRPTSYAITMRAAGVNDLGYCWYWVRTPGLNAQFAADVLCDGSIGYKGRLVKDMYVAVRPAMWVSLY